MIFFFIYSAVKCSVHPAGIKVKPLVVSSVKGLATTVLWYVMVLYREGVDERSK